MSLKQRLGFTQEPIYVMDGNAFLFRGYFANSRMTRTDGFPTGALFIVGRVLLKLLREEKPSHFVFIMDGHGKNFRHTGRQRSRPAVAYFLINRHMDISFAGQGDLLICQVLGEGQTCT